MIKHTNCWNDDRIYDYPSLVQGLQTYLKLKAIPIGMKRLHSATELDNIEKLRRPPEGVKLATDQVVGQCRWLGYSLGIVIPPLLTAFFSRRLSRHQ